MRTDSIKNKTGILGRVFKRAADCWSERSTLIGLGIAGLGGGLLAAGDASFAVEGIAAAFLAAKCLSHYLGDTDPVEPLKDISSFNGFEEKLLTAFGIAAGAGIALFGPGSGLAVGALWGIGARSLYAYLDKPSPPRF